MRVTLAAAVLVVAAVSACRDATSPVPAQTAGAPSAAVAGQRFNQTFPSSFVMPNPCNGEPVLVTGSYHISGIIDATESSISFRTHANTQGMEGVGAITGNKYIFTLMEKDDVTTTFGTDATDHEEIVFHYHVISQGSADNFEAFVSYTVTAPPLVITYSHNEARCTG